MFETLLQSDQNLGTKFENFGSRNKHVRFFIDRPTIINWKTS